jgi:hypothetical protein
MAVDEALARSCGGEEGVLRIYRWSRPTLSFGRNQVALGRYDPEAFDPLGADVVRRPTGGREVLHDRELTYSIVMPLAGPGSMRRSYRLVNQALLGAIRSLGVQGRMAERRGRTPSPDAGACFREPAEDEIEVAGRKLVGSAQARIDDTLLQHGSLLIQPASIRLSALAAGPGAVAGVAPDDAAAGSASGGPAARQGSGQPTIGLGSEAPPLPEQEGITLSDVLPGGLSFPRIAAAVEAAMAGALGGRWERDRLTAREEALASRLVDRYASREWTWRR